MQGTVKWYNPLKGYGFIEGEDGKDAFVHQSEIKMDGFRKLKSGQKVQYDTSESEKGLMATSVKVSAQAS